MQFLSLIQAGFTICLNGLKWLFGMAGQTTQLPKWVYYLLHYGVVVLITILFAVFNSRLLGDSTTLPPIPIVQDYWAGILFLLTYLFIRLLIYFIALIWQEEEAEFSDIDRAWAAGEQGLIDAGIDIRKVPLFLINGIDEVHEPHFFRAAGFTAKVVAPGPDERSPLRFYANQDALFISCSDVSAISSQFRAPQSAAFSIGSSENAVDPKSATLKPEAIRQLASGELEQTMIPGQGRQQAAGTMTPQAIATETGRSDRALHSIDLPICERRVRHLCHLIVRSRSPVCAINGLLAAVPLAWTRHNADQGLYDSIQQDVMVLHEGLRMMFPVVCMFTGLHQIGAVQEFIDRVKQTEPAFGPNVRAGAQFPPAHPVDEAGARWEVEKGLEWFRAWIYQAFARDLASPSNAQLYRMLCNLEDRRTGLVTLLRKVFGTQIYGERIRLTGCYYAGIEVRTRQQAFVRGVIEKLVREQELVAYPPECVRQDERNRQWGYICCLGILILACADIGLMISIW